MKVLDQLKIYLIGHNVFSSFWYRYCSLQFQVFFSSLEHHIAVKLVRWKTWKNQTLVISSSLSTSLPVRSWNMVLLLKISSLIRDASSSALIHCSLLLGIKKLKGISWEFRGFYGDLRGFSKNVSYRFCFKILLTKVLIPLPIHIG